MTLQYSSPWEVSKPGYVYHFLKQHLSEDVVEQVGHMEQGGEGNMWAGREE